MKVGITYDLRQEYLDMGFDEEETGEFDRIDTVEAIENTLQQLGFQTDRIGNVRRLVERLARGDRWDLVFNFAEGLYGFGREAQVPAVLDAYAIPYTFSDPMVCAIALHKTTCKRLAQTVGVPTADFVEVRSLADLDDVSLPYPLFAKPVAEGTGKGVYPGSVAQNAEDLRKVCGALLEKFRQPVLVETFLPGRELTVGIVGTGDAAVALGAIEVVLLDSAEKDVYSYVNKERCEELVEYRLAAPNDPMVQAATRIALDAWRGLQCRDAGRVDLRSDADGNPKFLEVNPLSGLHPDHSDLPILCKLIGMPYTELLGRIMSSAIERIPPKRAMIPAGLPAAGAAVPTTPSHAGIRPTAPSRRSGRRIVILHEKVDPRAPADQQDVLKEVDFVAATLEKLQYHVIRHPMSLDLRAVSHALRRLHPALVFNLADTVDGQGRLIYLVQTVLDRLGIPYSGASTEAMFLTSNKILAKKLLADAGIRTPQWLTLDDAAAGASTLEPPFIVKSVWEDASIGLDEDSVIFEPGDLLHEMERRLDALGGSAFVEKYVDGREFNVAVLAGPGGPEVLPMAEIVFDGYSPSKVRVVGYRAKWDPNSFEYHHTRRRFDFPPADEGLLATLQDISCRCFRLFEMRGYGRVDFRVDRDGNPWVLEVNANPCLSRDGGFMASAERQGLTPEAVISRILGDLNKRHPKGELPLDLPSTRRGWHPANGTSRRPAPAGQVK